MVKKPKDNKKLHSKCPPIRGPTSSTTHLPCPQHHCVWPVFLVSHASSHTFQAYTNIYKFKALFSLLLTQWHHIHITCFFHTISWWPSHVTRWLCYFWVAAWYSITWRCHHLTGPLLVIWVAFRACIYAISHLTHSLTITDVIKMLGCAILIDEKTDQCVYIPMSMVEHLLICLRTICFCVQIFCALFYHMIIFLTNS